MNKDFFLHASSYIDQPCLIGKGTKIWHFSHIMKDSKIGKNRFGIRRVSGRRNGVWE